MWTEHRRFVRPSDVRELAKTNLLLANSRRLIAEIDRLLERSHVLMNKQAVLHRSWRP
jgi:hypothetical protein